MILIKECDIPFMWIL